ncbi:hypothetical protein ADEAN_000189100 [Angomonas deanei]|uniref:Uncharacterized protein n=1 Tax=Angomonas deanei TaxID=59799 RepID=A0A7G2C4L2_9TRYP|nr:hypothetical protein ADEAN_000189100 [Angomonas deanei]
MAAVVDRSFLYGYVSGFFRLLYVTLSSVSSAVVRQEESLLILLARHLQSCHYRIHLYSGELLYQCSVFVVVASQFVPSGKVSHDCLRIAFQEVFSAEVGAEELFRKAVVEGNKKLAVDALEALMRTQLEWTCTFVPLLLNARLMRQKTTVARRLAVLASRHGVDIANTISRQEKRLKAGGILVTKQSSFSHWEARKPDNRIALSFGGISLNFPLYNLLDKVIHLCLHGEEKVAVTAAELFHFIVIWSIGKGKQYSWFDKLFPTVVILASRTSINITQELFHDLLIQSSHYFATTEHGEYFTNALFEKLQDKEAAIRRVSGVALVEYLSWASTTTSAEQRINQVLQRLGALFLLDSVWARIGGSSMVHLTLRAYVEGRFKCGLQDLVSLLKTVLRCLEVAAEATPQDELGIMEELLGAVRHFRHIFRKEKNLTDVGAKERAALGQQLLHCSVFIATLSSHSTNDVLTLLEQIVCGGAENTSPAMAEWVKTNMDLIEREFFPDATPDIGGMHNVLVVYTCFQQRGWLGHRDPTGVKRAREVESTPQLLQLFKTMVTRTANVIAREVDSTEYKESIAMQVFPADVSRLCTALSHFLTTCASSEAEGTVVQEELLTDTFFSFVAQQVVFESPSPLSTRNKVLPTGVERSGHLLRTLQVLLSRLAEGPQSVTVKEMGKKLVCCAGEGTTALFVEPIRIRGGFRRPLEPGGGLPSAGDARPSGRSSLAGADRR